MELGALIGNHLVNAITDRSYDTRLSAAGEVERILTRCVKDSSLGKLDIVAAIKMEFLSRANANSRKGGLMLLACIAVGPGHVFGDVMRKSVILEASKLLDDDDSSVRFAACECMYNVMGSLAFSGDVFETLFDALCKIEADPEIQQSAASFDRSLRELVMSTKSDETAVFVAVESRFLYPHNFVKQLSVGWLRFLRAQFASIFALRLPKIVPALISTLSHSSSRDIEISTDSFVSQILADMQSGLLHIPLETVGSLCAIILKYAKFQSSLTERSRVILFDFFRILSPSMTAPNICTGSLVSVVSTICNPASPEDVRLAALRANTAMMNCSSFVDSVCKTDGAEIRELFSVYGVAKSPHISHVAKWVYFLKPIQLGLSPADYMGIIRSLWGSGNESCRSEIRRIMEVVLTEFINSIDSIGKDFATMLVTAGREPVFWEFMSGVVRDNHGHVFAEIFKSVVYTLPTEELGNMILLSVVRVFLTTEDSNIHNVTTDRKVMNVLRDISPIGFLLLCIRGNQFDLIPEAVSSWHQARICFDAESVNVFVDVFECDDMYVQRMSLVRPEGRALADVLMNVVLLSHPESKASKMISGRLQLVGLSRCV